ncbi:MAG: Clp protease N-terminal domain-containing protein [Gemmatimonadales bacterium]
MSDDVNRTVAAAKAIAAEHRHGFVGTEHMLAALLSEPTSLATTLFAGAGLDVPRIRQDLLTGLRQAAEGDSAEPALSRFAERVVEAARGEATRDGREVIEDRDLLRPLLAQPKGRLAQLLKGDGSAPAALRAALGIPEPTPPVEAPPVAAMVGAPAAEQPAKPPREPREPRPPREPREKKPRDEAKSEAKAEPKRDRNERGKRDETPREEGRRSAAPAKHEGRPDRAEREAARASSAPQPPRRVARPAPTFSFRPSQLLLLALPVTLGLWYSGASPLATFATGAVAAAAFAALAGHAVEALVDRAGPTIGAVLHGVFGNVAALILVVVALLAGATDLARTAVVGAVVVSVLLVPALGALFAGDDASARINRSVTSAGGGTLALALVALSIPTLFGWLVGTADRVPGDPSPAVAGLLVAVYALAAWAAYRTKQPVFGRGHHSVAAPAWGPGAAAGLLVVAVAGVSVAAGLLVALVPTVVAQGLPFELVALVLLPLVTAGAERAPVLMGNGRGRVDLAVQSGLAAGTQGALVLGPVALAIGAGLGSGMTLVLGGYELFGLLVSGATLLVLALDDEVGWFRGAQMVVLYLVVAIAALFI